jgi:hypothetical protein
VQKAPQLKIVPAWGDGTFSALISMVVVPGQFENETIEKERREYG